MTRCSQKATGVHRLAYKPCALFLAVIAVLIFSVGQNAFVVYI